MKWQLGITAKMLGYLLAAGVLPLIVLGFMAFEMSKRIVIEQAELENARLVASFSSYLRLYQDQIEDMAANIAGNQAIGLALDRADHAASSTFDALEMRAQIGYILNAYVRVKGLDSIYIFSIGGAHFEAGKTLDFSQVQNTVVHQLVNEALAANTPILWRGIDNNLNEFSVQKRAISVVRAIHHFSPTTGKSEVVGVVAINLNDEIMLKFLEGVALAPGSQLMMIDPHGNVALHSDPLRFGQRLVPALLELVRAIPPVPRLVLDKQEVLMNVAPASQTRSLLVAITPRALLTAKINQLALVTFGVVFLTLLGILTVTWYFAKTIVRPIRAVSEGFRSIENDPESPHEPLPTGPLLDEISQLVQGYNNHLTALQARRKVASELRQAMASAQAANLAKSQFLATMSHEIRTPMNGILGMSQLLLTANLTSQEQHDYARTILSSGQTLLALLNDILDLSKIESGKFQLEASVFQPNQLIVEIQSLFSGAAKAKYLKLECHWQGPAEARYQSDAHRLRQMLSNLVGNAIKFTKQGQISIEGREIEHDDAIAVLEFSVRDTGMGISPEKLDLLFKPFSQADSSTTREFGGSGLGLSIVSNLARAMGGDVGVESEPGKGSRFWFRVRVNTVATNQDSCLIERIESDRGTADIRGNLHGHVMVVEDNPVNCMVIEAMLDQLGLTHSVETDGQQAVAAIVRGEHPDIILMDLQMPVMDGYGATERIRQWEGTNQQPRLPIVPLTADAFEEDRQRCLAVGMDGFLTKPITLEALKLVLSKWLPEAHTSQIQVTNQSALKPLDTQAFDALVSELTPMLKTGKFAVIGRFKELQALVEGTSLAADINALKRPLHDMAFDLVLNRLLDIAQQWSDKEA